MKLWILLFSLIINCQSLIISIMKTPLNVVLKSRHNFNDLRKLTIDLLYRSEPGRCYTIITDSMYQMIIDSQFFHLQQQQQQQLMNLKSTRILIHIQEMEDLDSPNYDTIESLIESKKSGCQTYLIYLSNSTQTQYFLKFIDHNRLIDTRSKFIILYDYQLFGKQMHYIWKRIINVIFIKEYGQSVRGNKTMGYWYELSTVPFPLAIKDVMITKRLDIWSESTDKYRFGGNSFFYDKTIDLKGQQMNVVVLKHIPAVIHVENKFNEINGNYSGLEIEIMLAISKKMNFSVRFYETEDSRSEKWGHLSLNGSYSGILSEMIASEADYALADLHYTPYHLELMDLSVPYTTQCLTFLTPTSSTDNSWQTLILPFNSSLWYSVLFFLFCVGSLFYIFAQIHLRIQKRYVIKNQLPKMTSKSDNNNRYINRKNKISYKVKIIYNNTNKKKSNNLIGSTSNNDIFDTFGNCIFYTLSMLLYVSLPRFPRGWPIRLLTGWYWIYCILVVVSYRASLTAILANPAPILTIDTLNQLAKSGIICGVWGEQNRKFFETSLDDVGQTIGGKIEEVTDVDHTMLRIARGEYAYYENEYNLRELRANWKLMGEPEILHIMHECAIHMPIAIGLEKNSPMKSRFDILLRRVIESGLINKWLSDVMRPYQLLDQEEQSPEAVINLKKMYGAFIVLAIGYFIGALTLLGEILYWKYFVVVHPLYDKYLLYKLYEKK